MPSPPTCWKDSIFSTCHLFSAPILNAHMVPFRSPSQWIWIFMSLPRTLWTLKRTSFLISIYNEHTDKAIVILRRAAFDIHPPRSRDSNEKVWQQSVWISSNEAEKDLRTELALRPLWAPGQSPAVVSEGCRQMGGGRQGEGRASPAVPTSEKFFVSCSVWLGSTSVGLARTVLWVQYHLKDSLS